MTIQIPEIDVMFSDEDKTISRTIVLENDEDLEDLRLYIENGKKGETCLIFPKEKVELLRDSLNMFFKKKLIK